MSIFIFLKNTTIKLMMNIWLMTAMRKISRIVTVARVLVFYELSIILEIVNLLLSMILLLKSYTNSVPKQPTQIDRLLEIYKKPCMKESSLDFSFLGNTLMLLRIVSESVTTNLALLRFHVEVGPTLWTTYAWLHAPVGSVLGAVRQQLIIHQMRVVFSHPVVIGLFCINEVGCHVGIGLMLLFINLGTFMDSLDIEVSLLTDYTFEILNIEDLSWSTRNTFLTIEVRCRIWALFSSFFLACISNFF